MNDRAAVLRPTIVPGAYFWGWLSSVNSQMEFHEYGAWDLYWKQILGVAILLLVQIVLIAVLLLHRVRQRETEKVAQAGLKKYQVLFESFPFGLTITDQHGRIVEVNHQAGSLLGIPRQMHETRTLAGPEWQIIRPDGTPMPYQEFPGYRAIREQHAIRHVEMGLVKDTGDVVWLSVTAAPIPLEGYGAAIVYGDISERKRAEEELQNYRDHLEELIRDRTAELAEERNLLRTLIDNMPDLILIKNTESRFLTLNPALARMMGANTPNELLGKTDFDFYPQEIAQQYYDREHVMLQSGTPSLNQEELHLDPETGEERWYLATKIPFRDQQGVIRGLVGISRDITEHKQLEEALKQHRDRLGNLVAELETANRELKDFAYVVSHDLKAPLRAISRLTAWLVEDYAGAFDPEGKEMAALLISQVRRMDNLIDGILRYSRIGRVAGNEMEIDLETVLKSVIATLAPPPTIRIDYDSPLPVILADATRIFQVFQNLIGNAVKFIDSPQGSIRINCTDSGSHWTFSISDNGPGIEKKYHERIFQIFQRLTTDDDMESTGIGLSIVKKIIEFYGGDIWVESTVGEGSCFYFTLPKTR